MLVDLHCCLGEDLDVKSSSEDIITYMGKHNISKAVLSTLGKGFIHHFVEENQKILNLINLFQEKFIGFCSVNPWFDNSIDELRKRVVSDGFKGVVFNPSLQGFKVFSPLIEPLIDTCVLLKIPVYFYSGTSYYDLPLDMALLAKKYPQVNFVIGQMGTSDFWMDIEPSLQLAKNLYIETSVNPNTDLLKDVVYHFGPERIIFGTGYPYTDPEYELLKIKLCNFNKKEVDLIMHENAMRLLGY
ncbi:amidohydrolase family protein [Atribacter laminatus]|uniref:Amidohydrolase-related domain-containing protein n=1 Tax=Atribacter laminatus TaxID=2847778 RepID=A0A7T1ALL0_ATRLM|nr:amidohydrolase family protein [Atribacter laminatus]QPM68156.1 hypothetical protein RT761_01370 [Atribacter laminatus]